MSLILSLLDKSPVFAGASGAEAIALSLRFAEAAEALGYRRIWFAEHHGSPLLAGSAPEVLAAFVLARTKKIRVGTGGVLLQHYSPFKVAEVFKVLSALAPGRVDLGIGKAPGGLPAQARALQAKHSAKGLPSIEDQIRDLDGFLDGILPDGHPHAEAVANPQVATGPQRFVLGASPESARFAASIGWNFTYAGHFNGVDSNIAASLQAYRDAGGAEPSLAVHAFADTSEARAREAVSHVRVFRLTLPDGRRLNLGSAAQAQDFARQAGFPNALIEETHPQVIAGLPEQVNAELESLARRYGLAEIVIDTPVAEPEARLRSIALIAERRLRIAA